jgi:hypothetical protein
MKKLRAGADSHPDPFFERTRRANNSKIWDLNRNLSHNAHISTAHVLDHHRGLDRYTQLRSLLERFETSQQG